MRPVGAIRWPGRYIQTPRVVRAPNDSPERHGRQPKLVAILDAAEIGCRSENLPSATLTYITHSL